jgi:hypothetical protein
LIELRQQYALAYYLTGEQTERKKAMDLERKISVTRFDLHYNDTDPFEAAFRSPNIEDHSGLLAIEIYL